MNPTKEAKVSAFALQLFEGFLKDQKKYNRKLFTTRKPINTCKKKLCYSSDLLLFFAYIFDGSYFVLFPQTYFSN